MITLLIGDKVNTVLKKDVGVIAKIWLLMCCLRNFTGYWYCLFFAKVLSVLRIDIVQVSSVIRYMKVYVDICRKNNVDPWASNYSFYCNALDLTYDDISYIRDYKLHISNKLVINGDIVGKVLI